VNIAVRYSVVIPVSDRAGDPASRLNELDRALAALGGSTEVVLVFDGHRGREAAALRERVAGRPGIRIVELHQRMGESAVLAAGLREARGEILFRVPSYAQVDLEVLAALAREVESGVDCALADRLDADGRPAGGQRRLLNRLLSRVARAEIRDVGCLVSAFTAEVARALPPQGDLHRYLPVLVAVEGFSTRHVPAQSVSDPGARERRSPRSYAARLMDFLAVLFLARSLGSPLRFFGLLGLAPLVAGTALTVWLVWERLFQGRALAERPLLLLGLLLVTAGVQAMALGFLGELMVYLHYRDRQPDRARPLVAGNEPGSAAATPRAAEPGREANRDPAPRR
jgi:hypothetical protein